MNLQTSIKNIVLLLINTHFYTLAESCEKCVSCSTCEIDLEENVNKWQIECLNETKAKAWDVLKVRSGKWPVTPTKDGSIQRWSLCILVKAGIMSPIGVFKIDEAMKFVSPDNQNRVLNHVEDCISKIHRKKISPPVGPEIGWRYLKCYNNKEPRKFKIV